MRGAVFSAVFAIMGLSNAIVPVLREFSPNPVVQSLIYSLYFIGALIFMVPFGILCDIYPKRIFIILGLILTLLSGVMISFFHAVPVIFSARLIEGIGCGAFLPPAFALLSKLKRKEREFGYFMFFLNGGLAVGMYLTGMVIGLRILDIDSYCNGVFLFTAFTFIPLLFSFYLPESENPVRTSFFLEIKKTFEIFLDRNFMYVWTLTFVVFGCIGAIIAHFSSFASQMNETEIGVILGCSYLSTMVASALAGWIPTNRRTLIITGIFISGLGMVYTIFNPSGLIILGIGGGFSMVGIASLISDFDVEQGKAMGIFNACTYAGMSFLPILLGILIPHTGYSTAFGVYGAAVLFFGIFSLIRTSHR
ncbi:MAG: MFS transporter [Candidatus Syntropharchaeia archaeon]